MNFGVGVGVVGVGGGLGSVGVEEVDVVVAAGVLGQYLYQGPYQLHLLYQLPR